MKYIDSVYGDVEIDNPIVLEIIESKSFQRLKGIDQGGYKAQLVNPNADLSNFVHSRYAHSIGVYLLLRNYNTPFEEQIAGLLHDVSHTTFSHCIDYVLNEGDQEKQNYQDNSHESFILNSQFSDILKRNNVDIIYILKDKNFPLKENNIPDICADRIDYSLRTAVIFNELSQLEAQEILKHLHATKDTWYFDNLKYAKIFTDNFKKMNDVYYAGFESALMFRVVADYLKYAYGKGYIKKDDFYLTDEEVIEKIKINHNRDNELNHLWKRLNDNKCCENNLNNYDSEITCKSRVVDPLIKESGISNLKRLSDFLPEWKEVITNDLKPKKYYLKFKY